MISKGDSTLAHISFAKIFIALVGLFVLMSCKPSIPNGVISPSRMEKILYDIHMADAVALNENYDFEKLAEKRFNYKEAVFRKYNITSEEFDNSMKYYYRHSDQLQDIYERMANRFTDDIKSLGGDDYEFEREYAANSDTANVWTLARNKVMYPLSLNNRIVHSIKTDTTHYAGDNYLFVFHSQYVIQDGTRDAVALMAIRLENDSVITRSQRITSDTEYRINISLSPNQRAKDIQAFIYMGKGRGDENETTLKMLSVKHISLLRIHRRLPKEIEIKMAVADSLTN